MSVPGVYMGFIHGFLFGDAFDKGLSFKMGQTPRPRLAWRVVTADRKGLLTPEEIVTYYLPLDDAERAYRIFENGRRRAEGDSGARCRNAGSGGTAG